MMSRSSLFLLIAATLFGCVGGFGASAQTTTPSGPGAAASDTGLGGAIEEKLVLSPAQRNAIYDQVSKDKSKVAAKSFSPEIGADVPPMIELYTLPDDILANNPETKLYKFTKVDDQIVLVDPTKMRVIAVIGPRTKD